MIGHLQKFV